MVELKRNYFNKYSALLICFILFVAVSCSDILRVKNIDAALKGLPLPTDIVRVSSEYDLPVLQGIVFDPENPYELEMLFDPGKNKVISKSEKQKVINYFLKKELLEF